MDEDLVLLLALAGAFILFFIWFMSPDIHIEEKTYTLEDYTIQKYDTFWAIYKDRYYDLMTYGEALHNFKQDNNMKEYRLIEGETVKLRIYNTHTQDIEP